MVDGSGLENRHTRKGIGGSNPSLSARTLSSTCVMVMPTLVTMNREFNITKRVQTSNGLRYCRVVLVVLSASSPMQ